jgi:hypothetical protein
MAHVLTILLFAGWLAVPLFGEVDTARKLRVYVTESDSWSTSGGGFGTNDFIFGSGSGGARPQTAEIIKTFRERCPEVTVTINRDKADYIVLLEHEGGKSFVQRDNKVVLFNPDGDALYSGSTVTLGNAVKDACSAIRKDVSGGP